VEQLEIYEVDLGQDSQDNIDSMLWLGLPSVSPLKMLHVSSMLVPLVAAALQKVTGKRSTEVFPTLHSLFSEGIQPPGSETI
jgi:hypothetical protein